MRFVRNIVRAYRLLKLWNSSVAGMPELPVLDDLRSHFAAFDAAALGLTEATTLDIGCGAEPKNPFAAARTFGLDIRENPEKNVRFADLTLEPIPYPDSSFDYVTAFDFIEHVPRVIYLPSRRFPFVELMNEIWRTLKPRGIFMSHTPVFPFSPVFRDPTHVNILTHETFPQYFDNRLKWAAMYGFRGSFEILHQGLMPPYLISLLRKDA